MTVDTSPALDVRPPSNTPLFEALVCETHHAAAMTAVIASCISGALVDAHRLERATVDRYLPVEPAVLLSLTRRSLLDIEPLTETRHVIDRFFHTLRELRRALGGYFFDAGEIGRERALVIHGRTLELAARVSCHEALRAVRALELETPGRLSDLYCDHARALSAVLFQAELRRMPCLDPQGQAFLPNLPQRRRSTRRSIGQDCSILYRKTILSAFAKDVSQGGIGLLRVPFLQTDDAVVVELKNGRRFAGVVAWCRGESAGIRFAEPLNESDPLIAI
jgi:hypothetical protein